ncbi:amino acid transporter AVT1I-like isoform X2 [Fagus crenata]
MEAKLSHDSSLTETLILDEKQNGLAPKLEEVESNFDYSNTANVSFFKTCFNGLNALSGVGILSVPYALLFCLILIFVIAIAAFYSGLLMQRCMDVDSDIRTYPDIGNQLYLVATGFLILEGDNLSYFLSLLSYISASGVLASIIILGSILWIGEFDGIGFHQEGTLINWSGIPTAVSLYAFCYCAHPVFPTLYTSMKNKRQFSNVLVVCFILCTLSYASMAVFGYLMFGSNVQSKITLNLPIEKLSSRVAIYTTLVNPIAKYALMVTPIVNATKSWFPCDYNKRMFSTVIVALVVPFAYLMSLVGAFLSVTASIILPCLCYLKISGTYKRFGCEMVVIWGIVLMGVVIVIIGTYISVIEILDHL